MQAWVRQYRKPFYECLRDLLSAHGIDLVLIYGRPYGVEDRRYDTVDVEWGHFVDQRPIPVAGRRLTWQPCMKHLQDAELIIVEQATRLLLNYLLFARHLLGGPRLAFWGHGRNFQPNNVSAPSEAVKRFLSRRVHWWFPYNELSAQVVRDLGFPDNRITVVQNAIDMRALEQARAALHPGEVDALRASLGMLGRHVGIYCGALYPDKRMPFVIEAADAVRARVPDFELLVLGDGVDRHVVTEAEEARDWMTYVGPKFGEDRVPYFALARVFMLPAQVGLAVLDSFGMGVPLVAQDGGRHSPEIDYLDHGVNGMITAASGDVNAYVEMVAAVLTDDVLHERLVAGCHAASRRYSIEEMAERFAGGIVRALAVRDRPVSVARTADHSVR